MTVDGDACDIESTIHLKPTYGKLKISQNVID